LEYLPRRSIEFLKSLNLIVHSSKSKKKLLPSRKRAMHDASDRNTVARGVAKRLGVTTLYYYFNEDGSVKE